MTDEGCHNDSWPISSLPVCILPYIFITVMSIYLAVLGILLVRIRRRLAVKLVQEEKEPSKEYVKLYAAVLNHAKPRLERIKKLSRQIVYLKLKHQSEPHWGEEHEGTSPPELEMYNVFQSIFTKFRPKSGQEKTLFFYALRFILKSNLMNCPYDIRGSRRCKVAETILSSLQWNRDIPNYSKPTRFSFHKHSAFKRGTVYVYVLVFVIGVWVFDLYTDFSVIALYVILTCQLDFENKFCPAPLHNWITNNGTEALVLGCGDKIEDVVECKDLDYIVIMLGLHNINHISFICISLAVFLFSKPMKKWLAIVKVRLEMSLSGPERDEKDESLLTKSIQNRYKLSIHEAGSESFLSMGVSTGNYMNIAYMLHQLTKKDAVFKNKIDKLINERTIAQSIGVSILSLLLAQWKAFNTQHEYVMCFKQKVLLLLSMTINTMSYAVLLGACKVQM